MQFQELAFHFPHAIVIGVIQYHATENAACDMFSEEEDLMGSAVTTNGWSILTNRSSARLNPPGDYRLTDELVLLRSTNRSAVNYPVLAEAVDVKVDESWLGLLQRQKEKMVRLDGIARPELNGSDESEMDTRNPLKSDLDWSVELEDTGDELLSCMASGDRGSGKSEESTSAPHRATMTQWSLSSGDDTTPIDPLITVDYEQYATAYAQSVSQSRGQKVSPLSPIDDSLDIQGQTNEYLFADETPKRVLICGWGEQSMMQSLLKELDRPNAGLPVGSELIFVNVHDPAKTLYPACR
eukprot:gene5399-5621_t